MKTNEQIKQDIVKYLTKASLHTFAYEDNNLFKVIKVEDNFFILDQGSIIKIKLIDIDKHISYYASNSKQSMKHILFRSKKLKSIKNNKYVRENIDSSVGLSILGYAPCVKKVTTVI